MTTNDEGLSYHEKIFLSGIQVCQERPDVSIGDGGRGSQGVLRSLADRGLIERVGGQWHTTKSGDEALANA